MEGADSKAKAAERLPTFVAFLRGINVGGRVPVKMDDLKKLFETRAFKFKNVRTVIGSGNVLFESAATDTDAMANAIATALKKKYKRDITVIIRSIKELEDIEASAPFHRVKMTPETRLYVTFLSEPSRGVSIPKQNTAFEVLQIRYANAFSIVHISPDVHTTDSMRALDKIFGPRITMRSWNTVLKIIELARSQQPTTDTLADSTDRA